MTAQEVSTAIIHSIEDKSRAYNDGSINYAFLSGALGVVLESALRGLSKAKVEAIAKAHIKQ